MSCESAFPTSSTATPIAINAVVLCSTQFVRQRQEIRISFAGAITQH
jgi:hypothetical protein